MNTNQLVESITNEFCEAYSTKDKCRGWFSRLVEAGLPDGVDASDPRVLQILAWCREIREEGSSVGS